MKKKGFTLVEMIVVIILISVITLMSIPVITSFLRKSNDDKYQSFLNDVFLATEAYVQKYISDYPELNEVNGEAYIYMSELVDEKLISSTLVNPKYCTSEDDCTAKKISTCDELNNCIVDDYTITVTKNEDGTYSYELENGLKTE